MATAISFNKVSKSYRLGEIGAGTLSKDLSRRWARLLGKPDPFMKVGEDHHARRMGEVFWALEDISFEVNQGDVLGIIGRNGAGKSTLLKILSQVTSPTSGEIRIRGRIASLLEVGTGFHPELTGRENIYLNGAILGMTRAEIRRNFDEIVVFSECEDFIDTPVKRYSSGMYVRLAFAVAAHLDPEILIVDEVLAVGDAQFQKKCLGKMQEVGRQGRTVLFVSHNMMAIQTLCSTGVVLRDGRVAHRGAISECVAAYLSSADLAQSSTWRRGLVPSDRAQYFETASVSLNGRAPDQVLEVHAQLRSRAPHASAVVVADILDSSSSPIMQAIPREEPWLAYAPEGCTITMRIDLPPLVPGTYYVSLWTGTHNTVTLDQVSQVVSFEIVSSPSEGRTFPHTRDHGFMVAPSTIEIERSKPTSDLPVTSLKD